MPTYGKENFKESNVNYLNKDFGALKQSLMDYAKSYFPNTYKDFNETSPGMMLLEMNAYVGDVLSFYVDQQYREMLLPLAEERRNIINLATMFGYKVKPIIPSYVNLTFTQILDADANDTSKVDYSTGGIFNPSIQVKGTENEIIFETLDVLDFKITSSADTQTINSYDSTTGLADSYVCERVVRAVSGKEKSTTFTIGAPEKFKKLTISDTNLIDIISCIDSNGNNWYEVDFLAQDKVPIETHYTNDSNRSSPYHNNLSGETSEIAVPYSLSYIKTSKRFTRETNSDNTTSLVFGNGILKDGTLVDDGYIDIQQLGITLPGQYDDLSESIDPLLGDEYSTLGETPNNTTLTIKYRVGGGINSNVPSGELTVIQDGTVANGSGATISDITVTNKLPARGGKDEETIDEIREKTKAFFATQNRCVTKEDYEARLMHMSSKFGNIAKVYVSRIDNSDGENLQATEFSNALSSTENRSLSFVRNIRDNIHLQIINAPQDGGGNYLINEQLVGRLNDYIFNYELDQHSQDNAASQNFNTLNTYSDLTTFSTNYINIYILAYNDNKQLVGNPIQQGTSIPQSLLHNIKTYLDNFKILTDGITIDNGYIVNFGVFFDIVAEKYANKQQVKIKCIEKIREYFNTDKMQFNQPIYKSQLEFELMGVEGVRSLNHLTITQQNDFYYKDADGQFNGTADEMLSSPTYLYAFNSELDNGDGTYGGFEESGTTGYGYFYDFDAATVDGIIRPPEPTTPAVFELKNPNENIQGRVR